MTRVDLPHGDYDLDRIADNLKGVPYTLRSKDGETWVEVEGTPPANLTTLFASAKLTGPRPTPRREQLRAKLKAGTATQAEKDEALLLLLGG